MDDGLITVLQDVSVTLQVSESLLEIQSPREIGSRAIQSQKGSGLEDRASREFSARMHTLGESWDRIGKLRPRQPSNSSIESNKHETGGGNSRNEQGLKVELPPLPNIADINLYTSTSSSEQTNRSQHAVCSLTQRLTHSHSKLQPACSWPPSSPVCDLPFKNPFGGLPPLTPPQELDFFEWSTLQPTPLSPRHHSLSPGQDSSRPEFTAQQQSSSTGRPSTISLPGFVNIPDQSTSPSTWLERTVNTIVSCHSDDRSNGGQIQMVVQALPSQSKNPAGKPAFQEVAEALQQRATIVPYITITHAVSQVVSMEEVPVSPPATPNNQQESDGYFDDQTIFTHAAVVPNYHGPSQTTISASSTRPSGIIAAPSSINIGTLERYIPPTTGEEVDDFFSISRRSYLVDRLTELSATNGTLLLVYPTQVGGTVFARQYIGPILDPFLRQFILLNSLTTNVAAAMGRLAALPNMKTFEEMEVGLHTLCRDLTERAPRRGLRGEYNVIHAEKAEVTLDRMTWMGWFIEQESARLRQNIIDYQKAGGRMPSRGFDASPGSLAREVVEGIKNSREDAGGVGIEVGVFVIRRSVA